MLTLKRLYLYGVLGLTLVPLLFGLIELTHLIFDGIFESVGSGALGGARMAREDLSRAVALTVVAAPIWAVHFVLLRRSLRGSDVEVAEERASAARATYFFVVLAGTLIFAGLYLRDLVLMVANASLDGASLDVAGAAAGTLVVGAAWLLHLAWRAGDLRLAPARTAGDWLTRLYLYGVLFIATTLAAFTLATAISIVARELLGIQPLWAASGWWTREISSPLSGTLVALIAWLLHWTMAHRLVMSDPPMGPAHRESRTRTGYFLGIVMLSVATVLVLTSMGLHVLLAELLGVWRPTDGERLIEEIVGPLVMAMPFLVAWWWHARRASSEAMAFGGPGHFRAIVRSSRLIVALVGLAGLTLGLTWTLNALLDLADLQSLRGLSYSSIVRDDATFGVAVALLGFAMWLPAWILCQRERTIDRVEVAHAGARRAYLLLVSGSAVVAVMGSLAYLVYQGTRLLLEAGRVSDTSWAVSVLLVAVVVLGYHLWQLRSDMLVPGDATAALTSAADHLPSQPVRVVEVLEISAPAGAEFKVFNAAIRTELPEGYRLLVLSPPGQEPD
jgi:hypothetical protein